MPDYPSFEELYVISDLHMGGEPGFQILRETGRLAGFVRRLKDLPTAQDIALVLNGDIIDTLAEDAVDGYVAMEKAAEVVKAIIDRKAFKPVWDELASFVQTPGRHLVIVIGNHDIELALPPVQRLLVERLTQGKADARARLEFSTTGGGYACAIGDALVFCSHGNEVDAWNYNRYEDIARLGRHLNVRRPLPASEWHPNAGTRMVKEVMNGIKRRYKWIDLLKPEKPTALGGILLTLDPAQARKLADLVSLLPDRVAGAFARDQRLGADGAAPGQAAGLTSLDHLLGPNLLEIAARTAPQPSCQENDMLRKAEQALGDRLGASAEGEATLGSWQYAWDRLTGWITGVSKEEALRRALLDWLGNDTSFVPHFAGADDDRALIESIHSDFHFIVAGHTHLARAFDLGKGRTYFNSGTWIRLIHLTQAMLGSSEAFKDVYAALKDGSMETLDGAMAGSQPLILDRCTAVRIFREDGEARGNLLIVRGPTGAAGDDQIILPKA